MRGLSDDVMFSNDMVIGAQLTIHQTTWNSRLINQLKRNSLDDFRVGFSSSGGFQEKPNDRRENSQTDRLLDH